MPKLVALILALALVAPILAKPIDANAGWGYWIQNKYGWRFYEYGEGYASGWQTIDGVTYYFDDYTYYMKTGWQKSTGGYWYYFYPSGALARGWINVGGTWYYMYSDGKMATGWEQIGSNEYYFGSNGAMWTGWLHWDGEWFYFHSSGAMATGFQQIGNESYYFDSNGAMTTGWVYSGGNYYYFLSSGAMARDRWVGNYYLNLDGAMATNQWIGQYYVGANGLWIPGYTNPSEPTTPSTPSNPTGDGWRTIGGRTYYYVDGTPVTEWWEIDGYEYYFNDSGVMQTGWLYWDDVWFYLGTDGKMATDWQYIGSSYYYFYPTSDGYHYSGEMAANTWIGDCYVGSDGAWIPGYTGNSGNNNYAQSLQTLKSYILANGFTNSDGNKVINVTDYSDNGTQYVGAIVYNLSEDVLEFCAASDGETAICVLQMPVSTIAGQNLYPQFGISFYESSNYYEATATINASTYSRGDTVYFTVTDSNAYTSSQVQELSNSFLTLGFQYWDVLVARAGLTLYDIGFTAY